ncbi:DUF397 domain-containing protein [Saccharothrix violaceirubra]|uniref:DUF397 domain-containing protein n=2 Tax=Saccharothrix violaceirubra TaxID=413306 RepID=UPI00161DFB7B
MWDLATGLPDMRWRKARRSNTGNDARCVEVANGLRAVRDSKNPDEAVWFPPAALSRFLSAVKGS